MIRIVWYTALVLVTLTVLVLLWQFSSAIILFFLSLVLAAAFRPIINRLISRRVSKPVALIITFGLFFLILFLLIFSTGGKIIQDLQKLTDNSFVGYEGLKDKWLAGENSMLNGLAEQLPNPQDLNSAFTGERSAQFFRSVFGTAQGIFDFFARVVIVVVLSIYWSIDHVRFERLWLSLLPVESRGRARNIWFAIEEGVGAFIRREGILSLTSGLLLWLVYMFLGIEYATLLASLGAIMRLIPWLGAVMLVFLPLLAGSSYGLWAGVVASGLTLIILITLEIVVGNKIFPRSRYSSILLMVIVIIMAESYGLIGAVFAPVLAVTIQILGKKLIPAHLIVDERNTSDKLANIEIKTLKLKQLLTETPIEEKTYTLNMISRLENLIQKTYTVLQQK
jgi:predicted PurR-regulated permease PerM